MGPIQERTPLVPERKLVIARESLLFLRLITDEGRLGILEAVTNSPEQPVRLRGVRENLGIPTASFFHFTSDLATAQLIKITQRGFGERTELGVLTLVALSTINIRSDEMRFAQIRAGYIRLGYSDEAADNEVKRAMAIIEAKRTGSPYII